MNDMLMNLSSFKNKFVYKVEHGETLKEIAEKFNTTRQILIVDNCLGEEPNEGDILYVAVPNGKEYIVKPFDSLESLSDGDKSKEREIIKRNKVDYIYVGQKIYI